MEIQDLSPVFASTEFKAFSGVLEANGSIRGINAGVLGLSRSGLDGMGLALLRLEHVEEAAKSGSCLTAGEARLTPVKPDWVNF